MRYRLILLDAAGAARARFGLECPDDATAIRDAIEFADGEPLELWHDARLVYPPGNEVGWPANDGSRRGGSDRTARVATQLARRLVDRLCGPAPARWPVLTSRT